MIELRCIPQGSGTAFMFCVRTNEESLPIEWLSGSGPWGVWWGGGHSVMKTLPNRTGPMRGS